ncbi:uncharacterized protein BJ212DRAFT_1320706, partial [Suillus subaureus]
MVPTPLNISPRSPRLLVTSFSLLSQYVPSITRKLFGSTPDGGSPSALHAYAKRAAASTHGPEFIVFACLIPVLVLLSGVFAGLTLGYMSLDETQLNVLSMSGTPFVRVICIHLLSSLIVRFTVNKNVMLRRSCLSGKMAIYCWSHCFLL